MTFLGHQAHDQWTLLFEQRRDDFRRCWIHLVSCMCYELHTTHAAAAAAKLLQSCPNLCNPIDSSPLGSSVLGFSREEYWSGLPFPSPMHESEKWRWSHSVVSEGEVAQSCLTLSDPMDCSPPGSPVHGVAKGQTRLSDFTFTFHFHALEKEMATHSRVLAWRIPGTGEPGGLPSMGSHRVRHDWSDLAAAAAARTIKFTLLVNSKYII